MTPAVPCPWAPVRAVCCGMVCAPHLKAQHQRRLCRALPCHRLQHARPRTHTCMHARVPCRQAGGHAAKSAQEAMQSLPPPLPAQVCMHHTGIFHACAAVRTCRHSSRPGGGGCRRASVARSRSHTCEGVASCSSAAGQDVLGAVGCEAEAEAEAGASTLGVLAWPTAAVAGCSGPGVPPACGASGLDAAGAGPKDGRHSESRPMSGEARSDSAAAYSRCMRSTHARRRHVCMCIFMLASMSHLLHGAAGHLSEWQHLSEWHHVAKARR